MELGGSDEETRRTISEYLEMGVIHRGFTLKCRECRQSDWYEIGLVTDVFRCSRCSRSQGYQPEIPWTYKLDELVYQCLLNRADCHILALEQIRLLATGGTFLYIPAFDVFEEGNRTKPLLEIDLACIFDGRLVLGECKTNGNIKREDKQQLAKYEKIAKDVQIDILLLSTLEEDWTEDAKTFFEGMKGRLIPFGIEIQTFTSSELL